MKWMIWTGLPGTLYIKRVLQVLMWILFFSQLALGQEEMIRHRVVSGETFYSLSKKYNVTIDQIKAANPGVYYPKTGETMLIPSAWSGSTAIQSQVTYFTHVCGPGETIFTISRDYAVEVNLILETNPDFNGVAADGVRLKVPYLENERGYIIHKVTDAKSTLARIAGLYEVELQELSVLNPQIEDRIWQGQEIKVPARLMYARPEMEEQHDEALPPPVETVVAGKDAEKDVATDTPNDSPCREPNKNPRKNCRIALMIPLHLHEMVTGPDVAELPVEEQLQYEPFRFLQFYQGFILAADSLERRGLRADVFVYDVGQDLEEAREILRKAEMKEMDLIIGPLYRNSFNEVASFAKAEGIPVVNPLSPRHDILSGNPQVIKVVPSAESQAENLASLIRKKFPGHQVLLVRGHSVSGQQSFNNFTTSLENLDLPPFSVVNYATDSIAGLISSLNSQRQNLVVLYSDNEAVPLEVLSRLHERRNDYSMTVVGLPDWDQFDHLENQYLMNLNFHAFSETMVNFQDSAAWNFIRAFRVRYASEPMELGYLGFDVGWYFLNALMAHGDGFRKCLEEIDLPLLQSRFRFVKTEDGGYENHYWNIYSLVDFQAIPWPH
jgi:LysM repeat protein